MDDDRLFPATGMPERAWWAALWPDPEAVLRKLGIGADMAVLDLCCGDGRFTVALARIARGPVFGLDLDPEMLAAARAAAAAARVEVAWIAGDAMELAALVPARVDAVLIANTFHGAPDKTGLARAVAGVLKAGGRLAVVNWHARPREETPVLGKPRGPATELRMTPQETCAAVAPAGFVLERVIDLPPYHYGVVFVHDPARAAAG